MKSDIWEKGQVAKKVNKQMNKSTDLLGYFLLTSRKNRCIFLT